MTAADPAGTLAALRQAVQRQPEDFIAWVVLAEAELDAGELAAGLSAANHALVLRPGHPEALARQGKAYWMQGNHAQAVAALGQARQGAPQHPGIALWLAHALEDAGEAEAAAAAYGHAYQLLPNEPIFAAHLLNWRRRICDWRDLERLTSQVRNAVNRGIPGVEPFAFLSEDATASEQLACARLKARSIAANDAAVPMYPTFSGPVLNLGFISNGFGAHPTGLLTVALFEALRAMPDAKVHLFARNADDGSPIRRRLASATRLHDVAGWSHQATAQLIRAQDVHILYDLRGWGGGGTPEVFALRPAAVQVSWLAYPGTSGAPWMDYALADGFVLPRDAPEHFSETVVRLPRCFQPSDNTRTVGVPPSREACGLPATGIVYCCFNNSYKLNPESFERMLAVLRGVPGSVLWLLSGPGAANARLASAARTHEIDPSRLVFMDKLPHAQYLARYRHADLFLDTAPYNAHTPASDALWAGCPVLTRPGNTFASRVAGSLNHHLELMEMNVDTDQEFIDKAVTLGRHPQALAKQRQDVETARGACGLFDMTAFAIDFAAIARTMAERHAQGCLPASFN
ncbi:MAG: tetratricopeptide repeat protein [Pseudomonadota bacterium]|nr:tetratricopeptide repeat protein [Pseudomonadota bacterium]